MLPEWVNCAQSLAESILKEQHLSVNMVEMSFTLLAAEVLSGAFLWLSKSLRNERSYFFNRNPGQDDMYKHAWYDNSLGAHECVGEKVGSQGNADVSKNRGYGTKMSFGQLCKY